MEVSGKVRHPPYLGRERLRSNRGRVRAETAHRRDPPMLKLRRAGSRCHSRMETHMSDLIDTLDEASLEPVYSFPQGLTDVPMRYCPGCTHPLAHRLVAECLEELDVLDHAILVGSVGCSVFAYEFFNCDGVQSAHGRAPAVATGIKRVHPENFVFT